MEQAETTILREIKRLQQNKQRLLLAIDGRCASGKTTLAEKLKRQCGGCIISMDDFFLRPEQRTPERLQKPGGNVDYERFAEEVLKPLQAGRPFIYYPYDCQSQQLKPPTAVQPCETTIVEGSYSCHPTLWDAYDLHIFLDITPAQQIARIYRRNGEAGLALFRAKWIPLEEIYFSAYRIAERCELYFQEDSSDVEQ